MVRKFRGDNYYLSNFFERPVTIDGITYSSNEAAFQAMKVLDNDTRVKMSKMTASESKKFGRRVKLRSDWEKVKYDEMYRIVLAKFTQNDDLKKKLLATGNEELVEDTTSWHDNIWGDCTCPKCQNIIGQNHLGKTLMRVREELKK